MNATKKVEARSRDVPVKSNPPRQFGETSPGPNESSLQFMSIDSSLTYLADGNRGLAKHKRIKVKKRHALQGRMLFS
jgi:hypothetical protein